MELRTLSGRYILEEQLGSGGMAEVYRAMRLTDPTLNLSNVFGVKLRRRRVFRTQTL